MGHVNKKTRTKRKSKKKQSIECTQERRCNPKCQNAIVKNSFRRKKAKRDFICSTCLFRICFVYFYGYFNKVNQNNTNISDTNSKTADLFGLKSCVCINSYHFAIEIVKILLIALFLFYFDIQGQQMEILRRKK